MLLYYHGIGNHGKRRKHRSNPVFFIWRKQYAERNESNNKSYDEVIKGIQDMKSKSKKVVNRTVVDFKIERSELGSTGSHKRVQRHGR